jgi:phenylalanyl-tRNA synthetase beta chain
MDPELTLDYRVTRHELFDSRACELLLGGEVFGYLGELSRLGLKRFDLRSPTTVAEVKLSALLSVARLIPQYVPPPQFPAIERDLNFVVDERIRWADLARTVRQAGGPLLEGLQYKETYRNAERLGAGKKSLVLSFNLRGAEGTLTSEEADRLCREISEACHRQLGAELRA